MAVAADRGLFNYNDRVSKLWPAFAQNGKDRITIADVLRHDAGLHTFSKQITEEDVADQANPNGRMAQIIAVRLHPFVPALIVRCCSPRVLD